MHKRARALFPVSLLSAAVFNAVPTVAQETSLVLEEVVVTAQRREQSLQDVPVSVSAFSGSTILQRNITSATDFLKITPGVSFTEDGQTGSRGLGIAVRGVSNINTGENPFVGSVGIYLDDFSVASVPNNVANPNLADMARVEVLRGPQGTFFGRNALGGALNLTTKKPTEDFEAEVIVGGESYEDAGEAYNVTGILNIPVNDNFRMRGMIYYEDSDGYVENNCSSGASADKCPIAEENGFIPNGADGSERENMNARLHLDWQVGEDTNILVSGFYANDDQDTDENVPAGVMDIDSIATFGTADAVDPGTGFWYQGNYTDLSHDLDEQTENEAYVGILNITHNLNDTMVIKSITGVIDADLDRTFDNDLVGGADALARNNSYDGTSWSSELRLEISEERYDFVGGLMYASDEQNQDNNVAVSSQALATANGQGPILPPFPEGLGLALNTKKWELESWAVFGDLTWHATDKLDLIVGARYTDDEVKNELSSFYPAPGPGCTDGPPCFVNLPRPTASGKETFDDVAPRFVVRYQATDDVNVYGSISKGYKAGGISLGNDTNAEGSPAISVPFDEETLWNYEVGMKSEWWDNRIRVNAAVYYLLWEDLQLESFRFLTPGDLSSNFEQTINVDEAEGYGGEIEILAAVTDRITLTMAYGYTDTEITDAPIAEITSGFQVELEDLDLVKAPESQFAASAEYRLPIGNNEAWVQLEFISRDGQYSDIEALTYQQTDGPAPSGAPARDSIAEFGDYPFKTPDYDVWNLRAGFEMEHWTFTAFVENLDEEDYYTGTGENFGWSGYRLRPTPRTIGGSVAYRF